MNNGSGSSFFTFLICFVVLFMSLLVVCDNKSVSSFFIFYMISVDFCTNSPLFWLILGYLDPYPKETGGRNETDTKGSGSETLQSKA